MPLHIPCTSICGTSLHGLQQSDDDEGKFCINANLLTGCQMCIIMMQFVHCNLCMYIVQDIKLKHSL